MDNKECRRFQLFRAADASGVSGTGIVLEGVVFQSGKTVISWLTDRKGSKHGYTSLGIYDSFEAFKFLHCDSHPTNGSLIEWLD